MKMKRIILLLLCAIILTALVSCATAAGAAAGNSDVDLPAAELEGKIYNKTQKKVYTDFHEAALETSEGDTLVFYTDVVLDEIVEFKVSATLDLNGHTIDGTKISLINDGTQTTAGSRAVIKVTGGTTDHVLFFNLKNGTIKGCACGINDTGLFRLWYVNEVVVENVNLINTVPESANETARKISACMYAAYSNVTINNTKDNVFQGRFIIYNNENVSTTNGGVIVKVVVNGGTFQLDAASIDPSAMHINTKAKDAPDVPNVIINDAYFPNGVITVGKTKADTNTHIVGGTYCFDPTAYVDLDKYQVKASEGLYSVVAK